MRSPFIERREDILPRTLRQLLAAEAAAQAAQPARARSGSERPRRRQLRIRTARRSP